MLIALVAGLFIWAWSGIFQPAAKEQSIQVFEVESGDIVARVGDRLVDQGIIRSDFWFDWMSRVNNLTLVAGQYELSPSQSVWEIVQVLKLGLPKVEEIKVTLLEGWRTEEIAAKLHQSNLLQSSRQFYQLDVSTPSDNAQVVEGYLFPDTYQLAMTSTPKQILERLTSNYKKRTIDLSPSFEQLVIASIVEREALFDEDRAMIAGVYFNRLRDGIKLDADPTVQYGKATLENYKCVADNPEVQEIDDCLNVDWWPEITRADYGKVDSKYNTYLYAGLPPSPISNPGLASIEAAVEPANHDYYYFVTDHDGHAHFARTFAEHQSNIAKFRS